MLKLLTLWLSASTVDEGLSCSVGCQTTTPYTTHLLTDCYMLAMSMEEWPIMAASQVGVRDMWWTVL